MPNFSTMNAFYPSVEELLTLDAFAGSVVVAGKSGLKRRVTGVNLSDTPKYYNWLAPNEIIASTCYSISDDAEAIRSFVPTVNEKRLAAIFLKPKQYLGQMPAIMIEQADELGIPLVELPDTVRLSGIVKAVFDEITKRENLFLKQSLGLNRMLIHTILGGADLMSIAAMLSEQVDASILILDTVNNHRALHLAPDDRPFFAELEMEEAVRRLMDGAKKYPMFYEGTSFGVVYVYENRKPITKLEERLLLQSLQAIPLEISARFSMSEMQKRDFTSYLFHLFSDPITDLKWEESRAASFGILPEDAHAVLYVRFSHTVEDKHALWKTQLISGITHTLHLLRLGVHVLETNGDLIFILDAAQAEAYPKKLDKQILRQVTDICAQYAEKKVSCGLSSLRSGIVNLINSNRQAKLCVDIAERTGESALSFSDLGYLRLIYSENPEQEISHFVSEILRELTDADRERNAELLSTLDSYLKNSGNVRQVAKELYTHYNTVFYRLKKIEEMTGRDLNDPDDRFLLELAMRLMRIAAPR